jgi:glycolate oxidase iron-sulfur subunit
VIERALLKDCVHCGFCLPSCPTYALWGEEMDSPRGRIHLMQQARPGDAPTPALVRHLDQCLGCMACETACPSGVRYGRLLEGARAEIEAGQRRPLRERLFRALLFAVLPYRGRLRLARAGLWLQRALGIERLLGARAPLLLKLAPELRATEPVPSVTPAKGEQRRNVGLLGGCVQGVFFSHVNAATLRVLAAEGCSVVVPEAQGCCGALSLHAGREQEARAFARRTLDTFESEGVEAVVVNAAGCGSAMKEYGHLLRGDARYAERARRFAGRVKDVSELLAELEPRAPRHPLPLRVAYHDACHLAHAQRIRQQPRALLRSIPGLELQEIAEPESCCGSAGIYNLVEPGPARALGERKARRVLETGARALVTSNPGCMVQLRAALQRDGRGLPVYHLIELLDASIQGTGLDTSLHRIDGAGSSA